MRFNNGKFVVKMISRYFFDASSLLDQETNPSYSFLGSSILCICFDIILGSQTKVFYSILIEVYISMILYQSYSTIYYYLFARPRMIQ